MRHEFITRYMMPFDPTQASGGGGSSSGSNGLGSALGGILGAAGGPWGLVLGTVLPAAINIFKGIKERKEAERMAEANKRPVYEEDTTGEQQQLDFMQQQAMRGTPSSILAYQTDMLNRGLTSSINAMLQAGGNPNIAAETYSRFADATAQQAAQNSQDQMNRVNMTYNAMRELTAAEKTADEKEFIYNKAIPHANTAAQAERKGLAGEMSLWSGADILMGNTLKLINKNYEDKQAKTWRDWWQGMQTNKPPTTTANTTTGNTGTQNPLVGQWQNTFYGMMGQNRLNPTNTSDATGNTGQTTTSNTSDATTSTGNYWDSVPEPAGGIKITDASQIVPGKKYVIRGITADPYYGEWLVTGGVLGSGYEKFFKEGRIYEVK